MSKQFAALKYFAKGRKKGETAIMFKPGDLVPADIVKTIDPDMLEDLIEVVEEEAPKVDPATALAEADSEAGGGDEAESQAAPATETASANDAEPDLAAILAGSVSSILETVGDNGALAAALIEAEKQAVEPRSTLLGPLADIAEA